MKTLVLVRHAKSDWSDFSSQDFDRTLNERGEREAKEMPKIIKELGIKPDRILSSPAVRAFTTARSFAEVLNYPEEKIDTDIIIYECNSRDIVDLITRTDDSVNTLMLFGHNPCISSIATFLSSIHFREMPTCSVVGIDLDIDSWKNIDPKKAELKFYEYPKKKRE